MFTQKDKIAKLQRLIKHIDEWGSQMELRGYGPIFEAMTPALSLGSAEFQEWKDKVTAATALIFGEHSHYIDDFNEVSYTDILAQFPGNPRSIETRLCRGLEEARILLQTMIDEIKVTEEMPLPVATKTRSVANRCVFIGHGRSPLWARLQVFLQNELKLTTLNYETESRVGDSIVPILEKMLDGSGFAVLVLTAEDQTESGKRARQNVIHEAGLFQGRLGFKKAILLVQDGIEDFSNVAGLQHIPFSGDHIELTFYELQRVLKREGLIS
jgi:hypothetical protein